MKSLPFFILEGDALGEGGTDELPDLLLARNSAQFSKGSFSEGYWCFRRCFGALEFLENRSKAFMYKVWSGISFPFPKHRFSGALELWAVLWGFLCAGSPYSKLPAVLVSQFTFQWP